MSFTAVIRISHFDESPSRALDSILDNAHKFGQTLIITTNKTIVNKKYSTLNIEQKPSLKVSDVTQPVIMEIPPNCRFTSSTIEKIETKIENSSFEKCVFHIPTIAVFRPPYLSWPLYGLLLVSYIIQWFRQWWDTTMYETDDIVVKMIITKGSKRLIAKPNKYNVDTYIDDKTTILKQPDGIFRHFNTHRNYTLGWWVVWVTWLSVCVFFTLVLITSGQIHTRVIAIATTLSVILYTCIFQLFSYKYISVPGKIVFLICFPLYLMVFPYVVLWYRLKLKRRKL